MRITAGEYKATLVSIGAGLAGLTKRGRHLVVGHDPGAIPPAYLGKTLLPWPNRITDGRYVHAGMVHELPINEHSTGAALHGLLCWTEFSVQDASTSSVTLTADVVPRPGYPYWLRTSVTYRLDSQLGLTIGLATENLGDDAAPYGASTHPYLTCDFAPIDDCVLNLPAGQVLTTNDKMQPLATIPVYGIYDFQRSARLSGRAVDNAYTDLPDGTWVAALTNPQEGFTTRLEANSPWVQVYTGDLIGRRGIAVEPMTCPPDAFNSKTDLIILAPGDRHSLEMRIAADFPHA